MDIDKVAKDSYTYIHKDKETGIPFYVGKGRGNRAHSKSKRSNAWKRKVENLSNGYEVEIIKDNISESEAYELENELIEQYGYEWNNSGILVNQKSGGDVLAGDGLMVSINVNLPSEIAEILEEEDDFKDLNETEQKDFINSIFPKITELSAIYKKILTDSEEDSYTYLENLIDNFLSDIPKAIKIYNSAKISFREFASYFQGAIWDVESELEVQHKETQKKGMVELAKAIYDFFNPKLDYLYNESND